MRQYRVNITDEVKEQFKKYLRYVRFKLRNEQAYNSLKNDYMETIKELKTSAGTIPIDDAPNLMKRNIRRIHFRKHRYVMLYTIDKNVVYVVEIHHELEDYRDV